MAPGHLILAGDFNCVVNASDSVGVRDVVDTSAHILKAILREGNLTDVALQHGWSTNHFTRWRGTSQARLDPVYVTGDVLSLVTDYIVTPVAFSDHGLVACSLKIKPEIKRKVGSRWLMNAMVFDNAAFVDRIRGEIEALNASTVDAVAWERFKKRVKGAAIGSVQSSFRRRSRHLTARRANAGSATKPVVASRPCGQCFSIVSEQFLSAFGIGLAHSRQQHASGQGKRQLASATARKT